MKKTLLSIAALAVVAGYANAETVEFVTCEADGTPKAIFVANPDAAVSSVADMSTTGIKAELVSGPVSLYNDGYETPLEPIYDNGFNAGQAPGSKNNPFVYKAPSADPISVYYVQGKGNPVDLQKIVWEEIMTDGEPTGKYRANWAASYYRPDGSQGLPTNGTFAKFTPSADGELTVLCWINKGNRSTYVVKGSDQKALALGTDVKISGWVHAMTYTEEEVGADSPLIGMNKYMEAVPTWSELNPDATTEQIENFTNQGIFPEYIIGGGNQVAIVYLTFSVAANETYYVFNNSAQIGISSYTYTSEGAGLNSIIADENAPVEYFNLQGIRVANPENGLYIRRQGKNVSKVIL